jgi:hypothetical protein
MTLTTIFSTLVGVYAITILYKTKMKKHWFILSIVGIVAFVFTINRIETKSEREINQEFEYLLKDNNKTIGTVKYYTMSTTNNTTRRTSIKYSYMTKDSIVVEETAGSLLPDFFDKTQKRKWNLHYNDANKGDKFLVLYNNSKPNKSIIYFGIKIKNNDDYKQSIKEIDNIKKGIDF